EVVVVLPGSPYAVKFFGKHEDALMVAHENTYAAKEAAMEAIFGAIPVDGILPVTASTQFPEGTSVQYGAVGRYQWALPEAAGMDGEVLKGIDSVAKAAVKMGATPGCVVLVMRNGKVVYEKGFGKTEYGKSGVKVDPYETVYDLASVTKIAATTVSAMKLVHEGKLNVEESVSAYLSDFRGRGLSHIKVRNLLQHNAGFRSWIPFYKDCFDSTGTKLKKHIFRSSKSDSFSVKIHENLYMNPQYQDSMWLQIVNSKIKANPRVKYSDLSMIVMRRIVEVASGKPFETYVNEVFYQPMGMNSTAFNPWKNLKQRITPPTEKDSYWRNTKVQGHVHDQAASMLGGVSGHAG
ncbi:MAG: serine hydrolase, partial [Bacteroidota bacterium]